MIKLHPYCKIREMVLVTLALIVLPTSGLLAQNDFRVSTETGLELNTNTPKSTPVKKPNPVAEKKPIEITCTGETTFDAKSNVAVFVKDVKVNHPQFTLTSDKLTTYLKKTVKQPAKDETTGTASTPPPAPTPTPKPDADSSSASALDRAVAEGNVVIIQDKVDEKTGEVVHCVGKGGKADYNTANDEMILSDWPQLQKGGSTMVALEQGFVIIMDRNGNMRTNERAHRMVLEPDAKPTKTPEKKESVKAEVLKKP